MTTSPINLELNSRSPVARKLCITRLIAASICSTLTGRFSKAFVIPARNFASSKGLRRPSCLITRGITNSAVSNVVKRSLQPTHSRRLRTPVPPPTNRESITLVSSALQNGQYIKEPALNPLHTQENVDKLLKLGV